MPIPMDHRSMPQLYIAQYVQLSGSFALGSCCIHLELEEMVYSLMTVSTKLGTGSMLLYKF